MQGKNYSPNRFLPEHEKRRLRRALVHVVCPCSRVEPQKAREKISHVYVQVSDLADFEEPAPVIWSRDAGPIGIHGGVDLRSYGRTVIG